MNDADSAASTRSPVTASEKPAPAATPLTAMISTASIRANVEMRAVQVVGDALDELAAVRRNGERLEIAACAEESARPGETTTFVASVSQRAAALASSRVMVSFMPFAASGRFSVIRVIGPGLLELDGLVFGHTGTVSTLSGDRLSQRGEVTLEAERASAPSAITHGCSSGSRRRRNAG